MKMKMLSWKQLIIVALSIVCMLGLDILTHGCITPTDLIVLVFVVPLWVIILGT